MYGNKYIRIFQILLHTVNTCMLTQINLYFSCRKGRPDWIGLSDEGTGDKDQRKCESADIL